MNDTHSCTKLSVTCLKYKSTSCQIHKLFTDTEFSPKLPGSLRARQAGPTKFEWYITSKGNGLLWLFIINRESELTRA